MSNTKLLGAFIGGAAIGSLISFVLTKEKYEKLIEGEIEAMRLFYEKRKTDCEEPEEISNDDLREANSIKEGITIEMEEYHNYTKPYSTTQKVTRPVEKPVDEEGPNEEDYHEEDESSPPFEDFPDDKNKPYPITYHEYVHSMTHIDKIELVYFREDQVIVDDQDTMIDNVDYVIGEDNLMTFGNDPDNPNVIYIRNPITGADYEIVQNDASYGEWVLGEEPWVE